MAETMLMLSVVKSNRFTFLNLLAMERPLRRVCDRTKPRPSPSVSGRPWGPTRFLCCGDRPGEVGLPSSAISTSGMKSFSSSFLSLGSTVNLMKGTRMGSMAQIKICTEKHHHIVISQNSAAHTRIMYFRFCFQFSAF